MFFEEIRRRYADPRLFMDRLQSLMLLHGITQAKLARRSGYDKSHVSRWLRGLQRPTLETMIKLDEAMEQLLEMPS